MEERLLEAYVGEKSEKIMMHDDNIASYQNQVTSSKRSIGNYNNSINASNSNISNMQNQIGELSTLLEATFIPEEKALIQQKIDNLKNFILKLKSKVNTIKYFLFNDLQDEIIKTAEKIGVKIASVTVKDTKSRWGSCSTKGNINYNSLDKT